MEEFWNKVIELGTTYGGKILLALCTLIIGLLVVKGIG